MTMTPTGFLIEVKKHEMLSSTATALIKRNISNDSIS
jgi:hypothetical protein